MKRYLIFATGISLLFSCALHSQVDNKRLTDSEIRLFDSIGISREIALKVRNYTDSAFLQFKYDQHFLSSDSSNKMQTTTTNLPGFLFREQPKQVETLIHSLRKEFEKEGYFIFLNDNNFGINNQPNKVVVIKADNQFAVLKYLKTNGLNYGIDTDSVVTLMEDFQLKYDLKLIGAGQDWCEFIIQREPKSWDELAKEVYTICPDVVDQGTDTVKALAREMKATKLLYFWWD